MVLTPRLQTLFLSFLFQFCCCCKFSYFSSISILSLKSFTYLCIKNSMYLSMICPCITYLTLVDLIFGFPLFIAISICCCCSIRRLLLFISTSEEQIFFGGWKRQSNFYTFFKTKLPPSFHRLRVFQFRCTRPVKYLFTTMDYYNHGRRGHGVQ